MVATMMVVMVKVMTMMEGDGEGGDDDGSDDEGGDDDDGDDGHNGSDNIVVVLR